MSNIGITFENFVTCDDKVATARTLIEEEILETVIDSDEIDVDLNDKPQNKPMSISEAKKAVYDLL